MDDRYEERVQIISQETLPAALRDGTKGTALLAYKIRMKVKINEEGADEWFHDSRKCNISGLDRTLVRVLDFTDLNNNFTQLARAEWDLGSGVTKQHDHDCSQAGEVIEKVFSESFGSVNDWRNIIDRDRGEIAKLLTMDRPIVP